MDAANVEQPPRVSELSASEPDGADFVPKRVGVGGPQRQMEFSRSTMRNVAMKQLTMAAERGDANAQFNLGIMLDSRLDDNNQATTGNRNEAIIWLRRAAKQGLGRAQARLAQLYADRPLVPDDLVRARAWYLCAVTASIGAHKSDAQTGLDRVTKHLDTVQIARSDRLARFIKSRDATAA